MLAASLAQAAPLQIRAQASDLQVSVGQQFTYTAEVISDGTATSMPEPQMPDFTGLTVVRDLGASQSSSFTIIGGVQTANISIAHRVLLTAMNEGTFTIAPAKISVAGHVLQSDPITIKVARPQPINMPSSLEAQNIIPAQTNSRALNQQLAGRLFMVGSLDNNAPYEGQPACVTYTVFTDINPQQDVVDSWLRPETRGLPDSDFDYVPVFNLAVPPGQRAPRPQAELKQMDGRTFRAIKVFQCYCIPRRAGSFKIGPYRIIADVPVQRSNDPFGFPSIFDDNSQAALLATAPLDITVKPLPANGRPAGAQDLLIGDFTIKTALDRQQMNQDELTTLRLTIEGRGNVAAMPELKWKEIGPFEVFNSSKSDLAANAMPDGLHGGRVYEFVLRPKQAGTLTIPPVQLAAFNPWTEKYAQLTSTPLSVQVAPAANAPEVFSASGPAQSLQPGVQEVSQGMNYIDTSGFTRRSYASKLHEDPLVWALQIVPLALLGAAYTLRRRRDYIEGHVQSVRKSRAGAAALRRLKKANKFVTQDQADALHAEVSAALRGFFGDKFGRSAAGLRLDEIQAELDSRHIDGEITQRVLALLESAEAARFAPSSRRQGALSDELAEAQSLIETLDRKL